MRNFFYFLLAWAYSIAILLGTVKYINNWLTEQPVEWYMSVSLGLLTLHISLGLVQLSSVTNILSSMRIVHIDPSAIKEEHDGDKPL